MGKFQNSNSENENSAKLAGWRHLSDGILTALVSSAARCLEALANTIRLFCSFCKIGFSILFPFCNGLLNFLE